MKFHVVFTKPPDETPQMGTLSIDGFEDDGTPMTPDHVPPADVMDRIVTELRAAFPDQRIISVTPEGQAQ